MSKRFELTPFAKRNLIDIVLWTDENFGHTQSDQYHDILLERCTALANGTAHHQDFAAITGSTTKTGLLFARAGRHFIIFTETDELIVILDFIHTASDLVSVVETLKDVR